MSVQKVISILDADARSGHTCQTCRQQKKKLFSCGARGCGHRTQYCSQQCAQLDWSINGHALICGKRKADTIAPYVPAPGPDADENERQLAQILKVGALNQAFMETLLENVSLAQFKVWLSTSRLFNAYFGQSPRFWSGFVKVKAPRLYQRMTDSKKLGDMDDARWVAYGKQLFDPVVTIEYSADRTEDDTELWKNDDGKGPVLVIHGSMLDVANKGLDTFLSEIDNRYVTPYRWFKDGSVEGVYASVSITSGWNVLEYGKYSESYHCNPNYEEWDTHTMAKGAIDAANDKEGLLQHLKPLTMDLIETRILQGKWKMDILISIWRNMNNDSESQSDSFE